MVTLLTFLAPGAGEGDDPGDGLGDGLELSSQNVNISETGGQVEQEGQHLPLELQVVPGGHGQTTVPPHVSGKVPHFPSIEHVVGSHEEVSQTPL
jgi:hypothetical protein